MSLYASKWEPITQEEYHAIYNKDLSVYSSYTNPDGNDGLSYTPTIHTTWSNDEKELIKCIGTRPHDFPPDTWDWDWKYWKAIEWENDND